MFDSLQHNGSEDAAARAVHERRKGSRLEAFARWDNWQLIYEVLRMWYRVSVSASLWTIYDGCQNQPTAPVKRGASSVLTLPRISGEVFYGAGAAGVFRRDVPATAESQFVMSRFLWKLTSGRKEPCLCWSLSFRLQWQQSRAILTAPIRVSLWSL